MKPQTSWFLSNENLPPQERMFEELVLRLRQGAGAVYPSDFTAFAKQTLGLTLWDRQREVLDSVRDNRQTVVESGNGVGKSLIAAALACAWLCHPDHEQAAVITLAPTWAQVINVLWRYIQGMHRRAKLPGNVFETAKWQIGPARFAVGLSPRRATAEDVATLQGYHSPHLLVIMDEAPGLPRLLWEAVAGLAVGEGDRLLAIGNPIEQNGSFFEACNSAAWHHIRVSCLEHPNVVSGEVQIAGAVSRPWVDGMIRDHCTRTDGPASDGFEWQGTWYLPGPVFESRVLGRPPREGSDQLIPLAWVTNAQTGGVEGKGECVIGLDPSRVAHGDHAAMIARQGAKVLWVKRRRMVTRDPSGECAGWLTEESRKLNSCRCFVDETGVGTGVVDTARSNGTPVIAVNFGSGAGQRTRFANKRTECWWRVRDQLQGAALGLPDDDMLAGDLTAPKFTYDRLGRLILEQKDEVRKRLGRSPDSGDALACSFALENVQTLEQEQRKAMVKPAVSRWAGERKEGGRWRR